LRFEDWIESFDALYFDDHRVTNNQIESIFADCLPLVDDWKNWLSHKIHSCVLQLNAKGSFVRSFEKSRSELAMDFNTAANDGLSQM
jgi:hypothetical protein